MGLNMLTAHAAFPFDRGPDWEAEHAAIDRLMPADLERDSWFDGLIEDGLWSPDIDAQRAALRQDLEVFRRTLELEKTFEFVVIHTNTLCYVVTGGASAGEAPTLLCDPLWNLGSAGILATAGSDVWTNMGEIEIARPPAIGADRPWRPPAESRFADSYSRGWCKPESSTGPQQSGTLRSHYGPTSRLCRNTWLVRLVVCWRALTLAKAASGLPAGRVEARMTWHRLSTACVTPICSRGRA